jgi:GH25 family lysozyme M1 (1,4-beta-N-acetylmuramidase)
MISGIDTSAYNLRVDWQKVAAAGAEFAIVKVTDGNGYTNPRAAAQVQGALDAGLLVALYHFAQPDGPNWIVDADAEGERLDHIADDFEFKHGRQFFTFLDVERNLTLTAAEVPNWRAWCREFRRWCREEGERRIGWYSGKYFTAALQLEQDWEETLLWMAQYPIPFRPDCSYAKWPDAPIPWARVDIYQHGGGAPISGGGNGATWPGVDGFCDVNAFAGDRQQLEELIANAA